MTGWTRYERGGFARHVPAPHKGTIQVLGPVKQCAVPVRIAFGFQRQGEEWGEAAWTARDLRGTA